MSSSSNNPKILLKLSPILLLHAIKACDAPDVGTQKLEHLRHGIAYFQDSLLCWTLAGVIRSVALEMEKRGYIA
jgi:mediator of RNA polymerase II transcription subunit 5